MDKLIYYSKGFLRASPIFIIITSAIMYALFQIKFALYFTVYILIVDILSHLLKIIFKHIYTYFNKDILPILGLGKRPKGAKYTSCFIDEENLQGISKSFGMPSGHSIISITTGIFIKRANHLLREPFRLHFYILYVL